MKTLPDKEDICDAIAALYLGAEYNDKKIVRVFVDIDEVEYRTPYGGGCHDALTIKVEVDGGRKRHNIYL
jgi:hypothetical protein